MHLAVNTRFLLPHTLEGFGVYTHEIMSRMVPEHPDDTFSFYFDRPLDQRFLYAPNVTGRVLFPPARHPILFRIWYDWSLRRRLYRDKPQVFFSPDSFLPLKCPVPAVITVHDVAHRQFPGQVPGRIRQYFDTYMPKYLERADRIITVSDFSRDEICRWYPEVDPGKIAVIHNGVSDRYSPLSPDQIEQARAIWAGGRPYFLYLGAIHPRKNLANLIMAYDLYRDRGGETFPLILAGRKSWQFEDVESAHAASPYKKDILFPGYIPASQIRDLVGGAMGFCYLSLYEGFGLPVLEAMAAGVPVICSSTGAIAEVAGDAALLADPGAPEEICQQMLTLIEDSTLAQQLKANGLEWARLFSWDVASEKTYKVLMECDSSSP